MPDALKVEPERLIERQGELVGSVVALSFDLIAIANMELLHGSAELRPRTLTPRRHPEQ
jgi:hypothetical protein